MQLGKQLPFSKHTSPSANGESLKRCSPLAFSSFFNDKFFLDYFENDREKNEGVIINQENSALSQYSRERNCGLLRCKEEVYEQYSIFETNGKFTIPFFVLSDIFTEVPNKGFAFVYFLSVYSKEGQMHKQIAIQTNDKFYIIDSSNTHVVILEHKEYIESNYIKRLTNLSVLMSIHERKFVGGTEGYDITLFKHLI